MPLSIFTKRLHLNPSLTTIQIAIELLDNFIESFVFLKDIASVNKKELNFSSILCNAICDQCNKKTLANVFIFCS